MNWLLGRFDFAFVTPCNAAPFELAVNVSVPENYHRTTLLVHTYKRYFEDARRVSDPNSWCGFLHQSREMVLCCSKFFGLPGQDQDLYTHEHIH